MTPSPDAILLTPEQMYAADAAAIAAGTPGIELMENAGSAIFREIVLRWSQRPVVVLCGPGNNGGDGFVVARLLERDGWPVRVALLGDQDSLKGDAALAAQAWDGPVEPATPAAIAVARLIIDGLFGAGLSCDVTGKVAGFVKAINDAGQPVVAIDVPSGIDGSSGQVRGIAIAASLTVTFCRRKPAHLLLPGKQLCGETVCRQIGIPDAAIPTDSPRVRANIPALWNQFFEAFASDSHKYTHGHAVVVSGGPANTGAARLAAMAALKAGAGLVTLASPSNALAVNATHLTSVMLTAADDAGALTKLLADRRKNAVAIGPAVGIGSATISKVRAILASGAQVVLDADALTSFEDSPGELFEAIAELQERAVILTPHQGEFDRLFKGLRGKADSKWQLAKSAARTCGATVVLKGADTVIASPDGRIAINDNAPPSLATAGSGDVLTGIATGLLARGIPAFEAACAAVWLHGHAGQMAGPGLIAEDLAGYIPPAFGNI